MLFLMIFRCLFVLFLFNLGLGYELDVYDESGTKIGVSSKTYAAVTLRQCNQPFSYKAVSLPSV